MTPGAGVFFSALPFPGKNFCRGSRPETGLRDCHCSPGCGPASHASP